MLFGTTDNAFTIDITKAPVNKRSPQMVKNLLGQITPHWGGVAAFNAYEYNSSLFVAPPGTTKVTLGFDDCQKKGHTPAEFLSGPKFFVDVPVPADAQPSTGTDGALAIWDPESDKLWEFWQAKKDAKTQKWSACYGGRIDNVSKSGRGAFPYPYGTSASGLATAGSSVSVQEGKDLKIEHAVSIGIIQVGQHDRVAYPANRSDGGYTGQDQIPMGTRFRLDPSVDVAKLQLSPLGKAVARASQRYGLIVTETAGAVGVGTMSGNAEKVRTGKNPWDGILGTTKAWEVMKGFPWDKLVAVEEGYGKPAGVDK